MASDIPPVYEDLGKASRDLFSKGFDYPKIKLSLKTKTDSGVEFDTNGSHDLDKSRTSGTLKTKIKFPEQGVTFTETWSTGADLSTELNFEPSKVEGLKLTLAGSWTPNSGQRSVKFNTEYKRQYITVDGDVNLQVTGPSVRGSAVFLYKGWYAGYQVGYEVNSAKLTSNDISIGYVGSDFTAHSSCSNLSDCFASVHHKVSNKTEVSMMTGYNVQSGNPSVAVGSKYLLEGGGVVKAKVNHNGQIGMGYSQNIRDGIKLSLSSLIEARNMSTGAHKLGLALDFEP